MKGALLGFALVALMAAFVGWAGVARADTPTPSPTTSPTPFPQSTITVRFFAPFSTGGGEPAFLTLDGPIARLLADGVDCTPAHDTQPIAVSGYSIRWPLQGGDLPNECTKKPPTTLRFEFQRGPAGPPSAVFTVDGVWMGTDLDLVKEFFFEATNPSPSPTPIASATATPASLPSGGGRPTGGADDARAARLAGLLLLSAGAAAAARLTRKHSSRN